MIEHCNCILFGVKLSTVRVSKKKILIEFAKPWVLPGEKQILGSIYITPKISPQFTQRPPQKPQRVLKTGALIHLGGSPPRVSSTTPFPACASCAAVQGEGLGDGRFRKEDEETKQKMLSGSLILSILYVQFFLQPRPLAPLSLVALDVFAGVLMPLQLPQHPSQPDDRNSSGTVGRPSHESYSSSKFISSSRCCPHTYPP